MSESADLNAAPSLASLDYNHDGALTGVEVASWLYDCFFLPGDWALWAIAAYAPDVAAWFGVGPDDRGTGSAFLSMFAWSVCLVAGSVLYRAARDADQRLTIAIARTHAETLRRVRIAIALLKAGWRRRTAPRKHEIEVASVELSGDEERVLRLHASLRAGYALTISDAAGGLSLRLHTAARLLERLNELGLVVRVIGAGEGEDAYALTVLGRALVQRTGPAGAGPVRQGPAKTKA